ncbi:hypothetical protein LguiB_028137 [Lonicera macranthoides]
MVAEAWDSLRQSLVFFRDQPVGTIAAYDHASEEVLNYDQVFVRDFVPSAWAFLMNDTVVADFGESAIGRVAPVDSGFWWIILLRVYTKSTRDLTLAETPECQKGMRLLLSLCLSEGFDTFPALLPFTSNFRDAL